MADDPQGAEPDLPPFHERDYCVQYRETDFNFVTRLMEEEGILYYFKHGESDHELVVSNVHASHPDVPDASEIPYEQSADLVAGEDRVYDWRKSQELKSGKVSLWDHTFELPHKSLEAESTTLAEVTVGSVSHVLALANNEAMEVYDWPGEYAQRFDGIDKGGGERPADLQKVFEERERVIKIRMHQEETGAIVARAGSNAAQMTAGHRFSLERHFNANGRYLVYAVLHKYGHVKVQFHWDREGQNDEDSSCWIRVASTWAGRQWGAIHLPRVGQEVVVAFEEGDPDKPIIVGSVYNADMLPPYKLPEHKTRSGVRSRSSLQGGTQSYNEIRFEDKKGEEEIHVHAERNPRTVVEAAETRSVGGDRTTSIGHDDTLEVKSDLTIKAGGTIRVSSGDGAAEQVMTAGGSVRIEGSGTLSITFGGGISISGSSVSVNGGTISLTGTTAVTMTAPFIIMTSPAVTCTGTFTAGTVQAAVIQGL